MRRECQPTFDAMATPFSAIAGAYATLEDDVLQLYFVFGCVCEVVCWPFMTIFVRASCCPVISRFYPLCDRDAPRGDTLTGCGHTCFAPAGTRARTHVSQGGPETLLSRAIVVDANSRSAERGWAVGPP